MSLVKCPECNNEISDQEKRCQFCGRSIKKRELKKKPIVITICVILFIAVAIFVRYSFYATQEEEKTYAANLSQAISTMHASTSNAEEIGDLIHNVWYNSIFDKYDDSTLKYMGTDFNESLTNLFSDEDFETSLDNLDKSKESVTSYMKLLSSPSKKYEESYSALKEYYTSYSTFVNLVSNPDGSLESFTESYNTAKSNVESGYSSVEIYIN